MGIYVVTYDLNREVRRPDILSDIKALGSWAQLSESSYAIESDLRPKEIYDKLAIHIDSNDSLFIITISTPYWGVGPKEVQSWLRDKLE